MTELHSSNNCIDAKQQVVVIGGSAAGLFTAYLVAKGGMPVLLVDECEQLGLPARTLIVTQHVKHVLGDIAEQAVINRTRQLQLVSPGRCVTVRLNRPDLVMSRDKLITILEQQARSAGVQFLLNKRCLGLQPDAEGLAVELEGPMGHVTQIRTRLLVGADGALSQVARAAQRDTHRTVSVLQATVAMPGKAGCDTTQVWFDSSGTRYFYWLIPESRDRAVVGLIADQRSQARDALQRFLAAQGLEPLGYQGADVPLYARNPLPGRTQGKARILLVGDAAAQVKATTVGGVLSGLRGAQAAARAILRGSEYVQELSTLRRELDLHLLIRKVLNRLAADQYDQLLGLVSKRVQRALAAYTRDEPGRVLLAVLLAEPRLLYVAARSVLSPGGLRG